MADLAVPLVLAVILGFIAFGQWMRHQRQMAIHKERIAAIEKGVEPPPVPEETPNEHLGALLAASERRKWPRGSVMLLSGLIWLAVGVGGLIAGYIVLADPVLQAHPDAPPPSTYLVALVPLLIGVAHLVVWRVLRKDDARQ